MAQIEKYLCHIVHLQPPSAAQSEQNKKTKNGTFQPKAEETIADLLQTSATTLQCV